MRDFFDDIEDNIRVGIDVVFDLVAICLFLALAAVMLYVVYIHFFYVFIFITIVISVLLMFASIRWLVNRY